MSQTGWRTALADGEKLPGKRQRGAMENEESFMCQRRALHWHMKPSAFLTLARIGD